MFQEKEKFLEARINDLNMTLSKSNSDKNLKENEFQEMLSKERDRLEQVNITKKKQIVFYAYFFNLSIYRINKSGKKKLKFIIKIKTILCKMCSREKKNI